MHHGIQIVNLFFLNVHAKNVLILMPHCLVAPSTVIPRPGPDKTSAKIMKHLQVAKPLLPGNVFLSTFPGKIVSTFSTL